MTTLNTAPLAGLLHQLFIDADVTSARFKQQLDAIPAEQRAAMMASKDTITFPSIHARRMSILRCRARRGGFCTCWREQPTPGQ
jgi:hypothetical protein